MLLTGCWSFITTQRGLKVQSVIQSPHNSKHIITIWYLFQINYINYN